MARSTENFLTLTDAYKYSFDRFYMPGTEKMQTYLESRGGGWSEMIFFGLQYDLMEYFEGQVITKEGIDELEDCVNSEFDRKDIFDRSQYDYILNKYGGTLPLLIRAVKEGTVVPTGNVMMTVENDDPKLRWLPDFVESIFEVWYTCTVASQTREKRRLIESVWRETVSPSQWVNLDYVLNDFGLRSSTSKISAGRGGMAYLLSFYGSDTVIGSRYAKRYYNAVKHYGKSVLATQHSITTLDGEAGELDVIKHILAQVPTGIVASVSDSYNILRTCSEYYGDVLKDVILSRDGTFVIRLDSGDPLMTIKHVFEILFDKFGYTLNERGYKVLPPQVRVLQSDEVRLDTLPGILTFLKAFKISPENLFFGSGTDVQQNVNRDMYKMAIKACWRQKNGVGGDVMKNPMEMSRGGQLVPSFKKSKAGRLKLIHKGGVYSTVKEHEEPGFENLLEPVFKNGEILRRQTFEEIRERCKIIW